MEAEYGELTQKSQNMDRRLQVAIEGAETVTMKIISRWLLSETGVRGFGPRCICLPV